MECGIQAFLRTKNGVVQYFLMWSRKIVLDLSAQQWVTFIFSYTWMIPFSIKQEKKGKQVLLGSGTLWGLHFHTNFIWAQRFIQISLSLPEGPMPCANRSIPVDFFFNSPTVQKPKKKDADFGMEQNIKRRAKNRQRLSVQGSKRIALLRGNLDRGRRPKTDH